MSWAETFRKASEFDPYLAGTEIGIHYDGVRASLVKDEHGGWVGSAKVGRDTITFQGDTLAEVTNAFCESMADYREFVGASE